jgi:orotate phosphoribosyltransferase
VNENVQALLRELGEVINDVVTSSTRVADAMQAIRDQGYELDLKLDANISLSRKGKQASESEPASPEDRLTAEDRKFLKRLKIGY